MLKKYRRSLSSPQMNLPPKIRNQRNDRDNDQAENSLIITMAAL
jgi:hypothetical protein